MDETGWCYETFLPDIMGLIIPMFRSPNAFPFPLPFGGSNTECKELQEDGIESMSEGGAGDGEPAWGVWPWGILQVVLLPQQAGPKGRPLECAAVGGHQPSGKHEIFYCFLSPWECR